MSENIFIPTVNQGYVRTIEGRIGSLKINKPEGYIGEIKYMEHALKDVINRMEPGELANLRSYQNIVMTPKEIEEERVRVNKAMAENRDKPSI
jgi:hypothetical protein